MYLNSSKASQARDPFPGAITHSFHNEVSACSFSYNNFSTLPYSHLSVRTYTSVLTQAWGKALQQLFQS